MFKKILLSLVAVYTIYSTWAAGYDLYKWTHLSERAWAHVEDWKIVELNPSQFAIEAKYAFSYKGQTYSGLTRFGKPYELNRPSAEKEITMRNKERGVVFFDPEKPQNSSLERFYPLKKCLYAVFSIGIFAYLFFFLRRSIDER